MSDETTTSVKIVPPTPGTPGTATTFIILPGTTEDVPANLLSAADRGDLSGSTTIFSDTVSSYTLSLVLNYDLNISAPSLSGNVVFNVNSQSLTLGSIMLDKNKPTVQVGGSIGPVTATVQLSFNFNTEVLNAQGEVKIPLVLDKSFNQDFHLAQQERSQEEQGELDKAIVFDDRSGNHWSGNIVGQTSATITVTMGSAISYNAVTGGAPGTGSVTFNNIQVNVKMPGAGSGNNSVTFQKS